MTYPTPQPIIIGRVINIRMSVMQAKQILSVLERTEPLSSSENGAIKMTIEDINEELLKD